MCTNLNTVRERTEGKKAVCVFVVGCVGGGKGVTTEAERKVKHVNTSR